jgi:hypothetical protein
MVNSIYNDKKTASLATILSLAFVFLLLFFTKIDQRNPPLELITSALEVPVEQIIEAPRLISPGGKSGGGGGTATADKVDPTPKPQTSQTLTNTKGIETNEGKGKSNKTTAKDSQNSATSTKKSTNPFGDGGDGPGSGGGKGKGKNLGIGDDEGDDSGKGNGSGNGNGNGKGGNRTRLTDPSVDDIESDANCTIQMRVKIDENGNVISATCTSLTTTISQLIKNKVCTATIRTAKYNKKPGAGIEEAFITVLIRAK